MSAPTNDKLVHGIAVFERKTKKLVDFTPCETGPRALRILGGMRINMSDEYRASEEYIKQSDIDQMAREQA